MTTTHPTIEHAKARALVTLPGQGGTRLGRVFYVDQRRGRGKVMLPSGKVLVRQLVDLVVQDARSEEGFECHLTSTLS